MAVTVYEWIRRDPEGVEFVEAVCLDNPDVNANAPLQSDPLRINTRAEIERAYNRVVQPDQPVELDEFEFVTPPDGWVNPNDPQ